MNEIRTLADGWQRHPLQPLVIVSAARLVLVVAVLTLGYLKPMIGSNAETGYFPIAERLITTGTFNDVTTRPDSKYPPLYPALIAGFRLAGVSAAAAPAAIVIFQNLCDIATAFLTFWAARPYLGALTGSTGALLWLVFPPAALISTWITAETMFATAFVAAIALLVAPPGAGSRIRAAAAAGVLMSVATLIRSTPIALAPVLTLLLWHWWGWRPALVFALGFGLPILPWSLRNKTVLDDSIPVAVGFGSVFLQGSDDEVFYGYNKDRLYPIWVAEAAARGIAKPVDEKESKIDRWLTRIGWEQYRKRWETRPASYPAFAVLKFVRLWCGTETGTVRRHQLLFALSAIFVFPGLIGFVIRSRQLAATLPGAICLATIAYFIVLHIVTLPQLRYMIPVYPLLMVGTAALAWRWLVGSPIDGGGKSFS